MMEAADTSEMSLNCYQTAWCNIPEDSHLHTRCCENLKSHQALKVFPLTSFRRKLIIVVQFSELSLIISNYVNPGLPLLLGIIS
jgi:hypothetical protein